MKKTVVLFAILLSAFTTAYAETPQPTPLAAATDPTLEQLKLTNQLLAQLNATLIQVFAENVALRADLLILGQRVQEQQHAQDKSTAAGSVADPSGLCVGNCHDSNIVMGEEGEKK